MNLSDVQENANVHLIEQQKNIIKNIEGQIEEVKQEEVTESLNYYQKLKQNLIKEEQNLLDLSGQSDAIDQTAITAQQQLIEGVKLQIKEQEKLLGINQKKIIPEKIKLSELSLKELFIKRKAIDTELEGVKEISAEYKKLNKERHEVNKNIATSLQTWIQEGLYGMSTIGDSISTVNAELGETISAIADVGQGIATVVTGLITGGPLGTIQAIVAGIKLFTDIISGARQKAQQEKAATKEIEKQNKALEKQLKILEKTRGTDKLKEYNNTLSDIDKQLADINKKKTEIKTNIIGREESNFFGTEKLSKYDNEKLDEQAAALEQQKEDLINELNEKVTGTTSDSITNSILQGFANGKFAAEDFADTFEDLMKNAMLESFKTKFLEKQFDKFYESFGAAAESGGELTPTEMEALQTQFNSNIAEAQAGFEAMDSLFEGMFGSGIASDQEEAQKQGLAGEIKASLTEETGTVLAGTMNSIRLFVATQNNTEYNKELEKLGNIEALLQEQVESLRSGGI